MDHLLPPHVEPRFHPQVGYYCKEPWDRGDFLTYPDRVGWTVEELQRRSTWSRLDRPGYRTKSEVSGFLQAWLFFGFLLSVFDDVAIEHDFVDHDDEGIVHSVHTRELITVAQDYFEILSKKKPSLDKLLTLQKYTEVAHNTYRAVMDSPLDLPLSLSFSAVGAFITWLQDRVRSLYFDGTGPKRDFTWSPPRPSEAPDQQMQLRDRSGILSHLEQEMYGRGRCPHLIGQVTGYSIVARYNMLQVDVPSKGKDHSKCNLSRCLAHQIEKKTYVHMHTKECQAKSQAGCKHLSVETEKLDEILRNGSFPVVTLDADDNGETCLRLDDVKSAPNYVAVSHVWSDGLGNPYANSMAACQVNRLQHMAWTASGNEDVVPFWVDTLCCPEEDQKLAISRMRETYTKADRVVVLDSHLMTISHNMTSYVKAINILISGWMSRLWTWQEGLLAKRLFFHFELDVNDFDELIEEFRAGIDPLANGWFYVEDFVTICAQMGRSAFAGASTRGSDHLFLEQAVLGLDGAVLGCDMDKILAKEPQNYMKAFWATLPVLPRAILFWRGERYTRQPGFRWAPTTFFDRNSEAMELKGFKAVGRVRPEGLQVASPGVLFRNALEYPLHMACIIRDEVDDWGWYLIGDTKTPEQKFPVPKIECVSDPMKSNYMGAALLVDKKLTVESPYSVTFATLVYVTDRREDVIFARRSSTAFLYLAGHPSAESHADGIKSWKE